MSSYNPPDVAPEADSITQSVIEGTVATAEGVAKDTVATTLETVGASLDATGEGSIIGIPLQILGIGLGGWSLAKGFMSLFDDKAPAPIVPEMPSVPTFQAQ
jgi:hypothetical protein